MGPLCRLIGSKGVDGDGTEHEVDHVDPFLFCDYVCFEGTAFRKPPFCAHPHAGVAVASILCEGVPLTAWDNIQGFEREPLFPGGIYLLHTGRGCVHDEGALPVDPESPSRAPFGLPGGDPPARSFRLFQLFFDAGQLHGGGDAQATSSTVLSPSAVPTVSVGAMTLRILVGRCCGRCGADAPATVLHGAMLPFTGSAALEIPAGCQGFLFAMVRGARVSALGEDYRVELNEMLLLPCRSEAYALTIEPALAGPEGGGYSEAAKADEALEVLLAYGPPSGKPFYKLLGYGGAVMASSEEKVRALMREYEQDPRSFGIGKGSTPADSSRFGLQQGYKDPLDGRGECQRLDAGATAPEARFFEVERGPYQPKGKGKGQ